MKPWLGLFGERFGWPSRRSIIVVGLACGLVLAAVDYFAPLMEGLTPLFLAGVGFAALGAGRWQPEEPTRRILETAMDGFFIVELNGQLTDVNEAYCKMLGYTRAELLEMRIPDIESQETPEETANHIERIQRLGQDRFETRHRRKDGKVIWVEVAIASPTEYKGRLVGFVRDITERKEAEFLLKAQRDVSVMLSLTSDLKAALDGVLQVAVRMEGVDCGGMYALDPATGCMDLVASHGISDEYRKQVSHFEPGTPQVNLTLEGRPHYTAYPGGAVKAHTAGDVEGLRAVAILPFSHEGSVVGSLALASHTVAEIPQQTKAVLEAICCQAAGAIARIRTEQALLHNLTQRQLLERQILEISDREQARFGQEIHDGLCQQLVSLAFDANALEARLSSRRAPESALARRIADLLDRAITEARHLSRGLFPVRLEQDGLQPALQELAKSTRDRFQVECRFQASSAAPRLSKANGTHLYRIAQEAVNNAIRHGRAKRIEIRLQVRKQDLELRIEDDGSGLVRKASERLNGMGLHIMDYRARSIGGTFHVSTGQRGGTLVRCCVPC